MWLKIKFILGLGFGGKLSNVKLNLEKHNIAPKRELMPQTSKDSELFKDLSTGITKI